MRTVAIARAPRPTKLTGRLVDFGRSVPPLVPEVGEALRAVLLELASEADPGLILHRASGSGSERDRAAGAGWLARRLGRPISEDNLVIANGTQTLVRLLFEHYVPRGGTVLTEALSYGVIRHVAGLAGVALLGLPIDEEGLDPERIEAAVAATGARLLYCNPTIHNPTTGTLSAERRQRLADVARKCGLIIVEDDVLGHLHLDAPAPIAAFAPELTWYLHSTTKALAHGLRVTYAVAPNVETSREVTGPVDRLSFWAPSPLGLAVVTRWIETGKVDTVVEAVAAEAKWRESAARNALSPWGARSKPGSFHLWLPTGSMAGSELAAQLRNAGVVVRAAREFAVAADAADQSFVRLSLSSPLDKADVDVGLATVQQFLDKMS